MSGQNKLAMLHLFKRFSIYFRYLGEYSRWHWKCETTWHKPRSWLITMKISALATRRHQILFVSCLPNGLCYIFNYFTEVMWAFELAWWWGQQTHDGIQEMEECHSKKTYNYTVHPARLMCSILHVNGNDRKKADLHPHLLSVFIQTEQWRKPDSATPAMDKQWLILHFNFEGDFLCFWCLQCHC